MSVTEKTDKREHILQVAEQLFADKGFDGTSVRDIAELADVNLAMISYYFGSKEKLLKSLIEDRFSATSRQLDEKNNNEMETPWEKIEWLIDFYVDKIVNTYRFHCILSQEYNTSRSEEIKDLIVKVKSENMERIKNIIVEGQKKKVFRNVDVELTMATMMGTIIQLINARTLYGKLLRIDPQDEKNYRLTIAQRLKPHLKQLMQAHLLAQ